MANEPADETKKEIYPTCPHCLADPIRFNFATMEWKYNDAVATFVVVFCSGCRATFTAELMGFQKSTIVVPPGTPVIRLTN
jgi:hypothetical protein